MLKRDDQNEIDGLLDAYRDDIKAAFLAAIASITSAIVIKAILDALERHDLHGAVEAIGIDRAYFSPVLTAILDGYRAGGDSGAAEVGGNAPFDPYDAQGEQQIRQHGNDFIDGVIKDMAAGALALFTLGIQQQRPPRVIALWLIGVPKFKGSKERIGGVLGLSQAWQDYVMSARDELTSGEAEKVRNYLTRSLREKRLDKPIRQAMEAEKPVPAPIVEKAAIGYADNLLNTRGKVIGETEALTAVNLGREHGANQAYRRAGLDTASITKKWLSMHDNRVRFTHRVLDGIKVPLDGVFHSISGATLRYPGDPNAVASERVGCRCRLRYARLKR